MRSGRRRNDNQSTGVDKGTVELVFSEGRGPGGAVRSTFEIRKTGNKLARLRRLKHFEEHGAAFTAEATQLRKKLDAAEGTAELQEGACDAQLRRIQDLERRVIHAETALRGKELALREARQERWRKKMREEEKEAFRWIKEDPPPRDLAVREGKKVSSTTTEALEMLERRWRKVWDRRLPDREAARKALHEWLPHAPEVHWADLAADDVRWQMYRQAGKAGGVDGWSGAEVASSICAQEEVAWLFNSFERLAVQPRAWLALRQSHLPKEAPADNEYFLDVEKWRPISVSSCWYRVWASTRLCSPCCRQWCDQWWGDAMTGAKKGHEAHEAIAEILLRVHEGDFCCSRDFSLAFDTVAPEIACEAMAVLGCPSHITELLKHHWSSQERWLTLGGAIHPAVQVVESSLPQGDPWSPLALCAVLLAPLRNIRHAEPHTYVQLFVDDRTWEHASLDAMLHVARIWDEWSDRLGLVENAAKQQWMHKDAGKRKNLLNRGINADYVKPTAEVLGVKVTGGKRAPPGKKERRRWKEAMVQATKARALPVAKWEKQRVVETAPLTKAAWGWCDGVPRVQDCEKLQQKAFRAVETPLASSPPLRTLVPGHRLHVRFRIQQEVVVAYARVFSRDTSGRFDLGDPAQQARQRGLHTVVGQHLGWTGWKPTGGAWTWYHEGTDTTFSLNKRHGEWRRPKRLAHVLREAWRHTMYCAWQRSGRIDARLCQGIAYDPLRLKALHQAVANGGGRGAARLFTGAVVSPAHLASGRGEEVRECPFCGGAPATLGHLAWECGHDAFHGRPWVRPVDALQRRLFWPTGRRERAREDDLIVRWGIELDRIIRDDRYSGDDGGRMAGPAPPPTA